MTTPEFSRAYNVDTLGSAPRQVSIVAEPAERAALAARFNLIAIDSLSAEAELVRSGDTISATGTLRAEAIQSCVASAEPVPETVNAPFEIHFRPQLETAGGDEEIELSGSELDVVFYEGGTVDLGEAVAETLSLSLDPYPRSPLADDALREAGVKNEEEAGPFAALAALRDKMK
ncbi:MAG: hypothetical protein JWO25_3539 [Alphaproteobacteria bacterium]|nr:hypothetical protein [Alphaproteobacteria bacterium]